MRYLGVLLCLISVSYIHAQCNSAAYVENCQAKEGVECEISGLLAYPKCADGFSGNGPVCWQSCPESFDDHGAYCGKPSAYGRGVGYAWFFNDPMANCEKDQGVGNCEWWGAVVYPKCRDSYYAFGCCVCSPVCPNGMNDIGVSCQKSSYGRGAGYGCDALLQSLGIAVGSVVLAGIATGVQTIVG